jgi:hypothetical protein
MVWSSFDPEALITVTAELWLVHALPGGTEEIQYQKIQTVPLGGRFTFAPLLVERPAARATVNVTGYVQAQRLPDGHEQLGIGIIRRASEEGDQNRGSLGSSGRTIAMPRDGEVISIEIPSCCDPENVGAHGLSLRLRITR